MSYKNKSEVMNRVKEHYDWVVQQGYEVVAVFLQGSWNYGETMTDEESDVDTKCWVLPTLEQLALNKKPVSYTHVFENSEHCDVKDLRLYMDCFKKQNVNFVEVLFTDYYVVNPKYEKYVELLRDNRERVAHYDEKAALNCMLGMAYQKQKALCHPYEGLKEKLAKYGYDGKQLSHAMRMFFMAMDYKDSEYKTLLVMPDEVGRYLKALKRHTDFVTDDGKVVSALTVEQAKEKMDRTVNTLKRYVNDCTFNEKDKEVEALFDKVLVDCLTTYLKGSL